jgi:hypothetical protein
MTTSRQRLAARARRLSRGDGRCEARRVSDLAVALCDEVESVADTRDRFDYWSEAMTYVTRRARQDYARTTGRFPPLDGPA